MELTEYTDFWRKHGPVYMRVAHDGGYDYGYAYESPEGREAGKELFIERATAAFLKRNKIKEDSQ